MNMMLLNNKLTWITHITWLSDMSIATSDDTKSHRFHEFLKLENEIGNITRQEAVSMVGYFLYSFNLWGHAKWSSFIFRILNGSVPVGYCYFRLFKNLTNVSLMIVLRQVPPLFLDVHPDHFVLDSKQFLVYKVLFCYFYLFWPASCLIQN